MHLSPTRTTHISWRDRLSLLPVALFAVCLNAAVLPAVAQDMPAAIAGQGATGEVKSTITPPTTQEVVAEGRAAIGVGGVLGARKAAEAQALRNAVEKAIGVFVSAQTLTQNYSMVRDQVVTRADGYATLKEVIKEEIGADEVKVTVRAVVSLKPIAEQLKGLGLTRAWRVCIVASAGDKKGPAGGDASQPLSGAVAALEKTLTDAGFPVVSSPKDADITVTVSPRYTNIAARPVQAGNVPMTMYSERSDLVVRAVRSGTGEVVAVFSGADVALHIQPDTARATAAEDVMTLLAPRLAESLLVLPAAQSQPVALVVSGLRGVGEAGKLEEALETLPGVRTVQRRSYTNGTATWELDVFTDAAPQLSRNLEELPALRPFRLTVGTETKARISATARVTAPPPKPKTPVRTTKGSPR